MTSHTHFPHGAVSWEAGSYRIVSIWVTLTTKDAYSLSISHCSTSQPYCKKASTHLLNLRSKCSPVSYTAYWAPRYAVGPLCMGSNRCPKSYIQGWCNISVRPGKDCGWVGLSNVHLIWVPFRGVIMALFLWPYTAPRVDWDQQGKVVHEQVLEPMVEEDDSETCHQPRLIKNYSQ